MKNIRANWFISLAITALLTVGMLSGCKESNSSAPTSTVQTPDPSTIDLSHAIDVQNRHTDEMLAIRGVNGTGVGLEGSTPVVYVFTQDEHVANIPAQLEDVKTHIEYIGTVIALAGKPVAGYKGLSRNPMVSGYGAGPDTITNSQCFVGTMACVVKSNTSDTYYSLSNNHVYARINAATIGERIDQPGRVDAVPACSQTGKVASLANFVPIVMGTTSSVNNKVDCAIAELTVSATTRAAGGYTPSTTTVNPAVNMGVKKSGRTTGLTTGSISAINVTISVNYGVGTARFIGQVMISGKFSDSGDSGSLIVTNNNAANPVALLFAGSTNSTIANPINDVLSALNVSIVPGTPGTP
jgi:hypothetical protein